MISLVASGADSNPAGASAFVGIPQPIGIANGDLVIVALALPATGVVVTPPSSDWTQLVATDTAQPMAMSVWWTTALNLSANLVFALSASCRATGACVAYRGVDSFTPIEASVATLTAAATAHAVGGITAQQASEEALLFLAAAASGTYTPTGGFIETVRKQQTGCTIEAQHQQLQNAGALAAFAEAFSASAAGVSVIIILAPSAGTLTYDDTYARTFGALPKGIDNLLDFTAGAGDFYKYFWVIGSMLKLGFDLVDLVAQEIVPFLSRYKLPDWERLFGLLQTLTAQRGTIPQRQAQVLGAWRAAAAKSASFPTVAATLGPLLGYFPTTPVQIIEADRSALTLAHSFDFCHGVDVTLSQGTTTTLTVDVNDGGKVSKMGAQLTLTFLTADTTMMVFTLTAPDGTSKTWAAGAVNSPLWLTAPELAGAQIQGQWTLVITNNSSAIGSFNTLYSSLQLFVEGIGPRQQTGGAIFEWGVFADPAHLGENGTPPDFNASRVAVRKLSFSHSLPSLLQSLSPYPNTDSGIHAAIPDEAIPV